MKKTVLCFISVIIFISCYLFLPLTAIHAQENKLNLSNSKFGRLGPNELVDRGIEKAKLGRFQEAMDDYIAALAMPGIRDDTKAVALANRGSVKSKLGLFYEAIEDYNIALAVPSISNVTKAYALNMRGVAKRQLSLYIEAFEDFDKVLGMTGIDNDIKSLARHNLELTRPFMMQQVINRIR